MTRKERPSTAPVAGLDDTVIRPIDEIIMTELRALLGDAMLDLTEVVQEIETTLAACLATGDTRIIPELEAQLGLLAEMHKVKATKAALRGAVAVIRTGVRVAVGS